MLETHKLKKSHFNVYAHLVNYLAKPLTNNHDGQQPLKEDIILKKEQDFLCILLNTFYTIIFKDK